jgi:thiol-disulfide isomerase/thioredoxin
MYASAKAPDRSKPVTDRIRELGFVPPLYRRPWNDSMQRAMGRTLAMAHVPDLPQASATEILQITKARVAYLMDRDRSDEAVAAWIQLRQASDSYEAAVAQAELQNDLGEPEAAIAALSDAIHLAVAPAANDVARMDTARQAIELGHAFGRRAELARTLGQEGVLDLWLARALAPHPRWDALPSDPPQATTADAIAGLQTEPILLWSTVASLLEPTDGAYFVLKARAQESAGHRDAAFASFTRARTLGADIADGLERTYLGLAVPGPASMAVSARQAEIAEEYAARRAGLYPPDGLPDPKIIAAPPSAIHGSRPRVGRSMPAWKAEFDGVFIDPEALRGEVYVLAIWASWCGPCREELPEISQVIGRLRAEGLPVRGLAVSTDHNRVAYERFRRAESWEALEVARESSLRERFRIGSLPTTWVVAADGTVVHQQIGYDPAFAAKLERILRKHAR